MENLDEILDAPADTQRTLRYAGFWIRVGASFIDWIIMTIVNAVITSFVAGWTGGLICLAIGVAYVAYMESSENQATFGKMAVGLKVGDANGEQLTLMNAIGRYFAKFLSAIILFIGFMMVGWDEKNQGLHDKLAGTYVYYA